MSILSDPARFRRSVAALGLALGPLLFAIADLTRLTVDGGAETEAELLAVVSESPGRWQLAASLNIAAVILLLPAVLGLVHLLRHRSTVLGHLGGALALLGVLGWAAHYARYFGFYGAAASPDVEREAIVALIDNWMGNPDTAVYVLLFVVAYHLGMLLLAVGLLRSRVTYRWAALAFFAGISLYIPLSFSPLAESLPAVAAVQALLVAGLAGTGLYVWRLADLDWDVLARPVVDEELPT